jgi:hypothetical protein
MILQHTIQFRNNKLHIIVDYNSTTNEIDFFNYATIEDDKHEVDISDMFTSYLNGEEIIEKIDWDKIYKETQYEKDI